MRIVQRPRHAKSLVHQYEAEETPNVPMVLSHRMADAAKPGVWVLVLLPNLAVDLRVHIADCHVSHSLSKLLVYPLVTPTRVPLINPYKTPLQGVWTIALCAANIWYCLTMLVSRLAHLVQVIFYRLKLAPSWKLIEMARTMSQEWAIRTQTP